MKKYKSRKKTSKSTKKLQNMITYQKNRLFEKKMSMKKFPKIFAHFLSCRISSFDKIENDKKLLIKKI